MVLVLLGVGVPAVVRAGTPGSDPTNGSWVGGVVAHPGPEPLVLWRLPGSNGALGTCIDARVNGPLRGPYRLTATIDDPVYAELNHLYANAATPDVRLAELSALNSAKYDVVDRTQQWRYIVNRAGGTSVADANAMLAHAAALAGPYVVTVSLPRGELPAGVAHQGTVTVTAAHGARVPHAPVALRASGATLSAATVTTGSAGTAPFRFTIGSGTARTFSITAST